MEFEVDDLKINYPNISKGRILEPSASICIPCRGVRYLCGRSYCPLILKTTKLIRTIELRKRVIQGSSPPAVFVGRFGYPKVRIGPLLPSLLGDTSRYDFPEGWSALRLEDILNFRFSMVRSYKFASIEEARIEPNWLQSLQEMVASRNPVDMEVKLASIPSNKPLLDDVVEPLGPSARLEHFTFLSNFKIDDRVEKAYYDRDLKAGEALFKLYLENVEISRLSKILSLGMLGTRKNRKLVPTRWSITAVDDTVSKKLVERIKDFETIDNIRVFYIEKHLNRFVVMLFPSKWLYEWIECWYPQTTWNLYGQEPEAEGDYEGYSGRKEYASLGGCYYAVRLAIAEYLYKEKKQAGALAIREILPGFITSIGVWFVRESIRDLLKQKYIEVDNYTGALDYIFSKLKFNRNKLIEKSKILKYIYFQKKIEDYLDKFNT
ncbi:MAG TPA: Nre family DNA repair protein [Geobacterales bacterium]|nr:Nre family DNA repair protein [Geobacterales bacterium]